MKRFDRTLRLIDDLSPLTRARVLLVGAGGVGGYVFEALVRGGVGSITVVDGDRVEESNINRQILALYSTLGMFKADAARARAADINPDCRVTAVRLRFNAETAETILKTGYDYIADAIDSVADKALLITEAARRGIPILSAMGAGNRLDCDFRISDVYATAYDGLAKALRKRLREAGVQRLKTVCSSRPPLDRPGSSISYPPAVMGEMMAGEIIRDLLCR